MVRVDDRLRVIARAIRSWSRCPLCRRRSRRVHSWYCRTLADVPAFGRPVTIELHVRRFFCPARRCRRRIFAERLPDLAAASAQRTARAQAQLRAVGFAAGGEGGARLLPLLALAGSPDTILRLLHRTPTPAFAAPRVLGVDDFALRRGRRYGTILVDLERHCVVDVLADRTAATLAAWLAAHPGVAVISRDRAGAYADGARQGAPAARQVADRFHLAKKLGEAVERVLTRQPAALRVAADAVAAQRVTDQPPPPAPDAGGRDQDGPARLPAVEPGTAAERARQARRSRRAARYEEVVRLHDEGLGIQTIAKRLGMGRHTIRRYLRAGALPERISRARRPGILAAHEPYLRSRWDAGCRNAAQLHRELRERGFAGSASLLRQFLRRWRPTAGRPGPPRKAAPTPPGAAPAPCPIRSPRQARWLLWRCPDELDAEDRAYRDALVAAWPSAQLVSELAQGFVRLLRGRDASGLDAWLDAAHGSDIPELRGFARGLEQDRAAVEAGISEEYSNGQTEGQVNRLKALKRSMYGRASLELLKRRLIESA